jgi:hypothetical protein
VGCGAGLRAHLLLSIDTCADKISNLIVGFKTRLKICRGAEDVVLVPCRHRGCSPEGEQDVKLREVQIVTMPMEMRLNRKKPTI